MADKPILQLHWRLFLPLMGLLWLIIGITIVYFVRHEEHRQKENLENRLLNVNNTVISAYEQGADLQKTVDFIKLFTDQTTLDPLRLTVYSDSGKMIADNPGATIPLQDYAGNATSEVNRLLHSSKGSTVHDISLDDNKFMISSAASPDGKIRILAALPYEGEVIAFLSINPMVWIVVIMLGILLSVLIYFGVRAICGNVYSLRDFAQAIASDDVPDTMDSWHFSKDEFGDVSRNLLTVYRDKIHAEQEKMHHERQIAINVSHELNTPVGIIKGYIDSVISDNDMPEELKHKFLKRAQQNIDRLVNLVNDVSMVMRLQENGIDIECASLNFHDIIAQLAEDITQGHVIDNMVFTYDIPDECMIMGHESLLTNALLNLIYNAAQHSGGSKVSLNWIREENGKHVFKFSDNGSGVDDEHLARLFDLFYRVDAGRSRKSGGPGLGLPLVHRIITAMGGEITVENAKNGGLEFTFSLPKG